MEKVVITKELMCPFNECRIASGQDNEGNEIYKKMDVRCEECEYVWNRSPVVIKRQHIDENSKEYKEYEMLHTPVCVNDVNISDDCMNLQLDDIKKVK